MNLFYLPWIRCFLLIETSSCLKNININISVFSLSLFDYQYPTAMKKIRILITDDHALLRETWGYLLKNDGRFEVVGECGSAEEAIMLSIKLHPDLVLMDIKLPGMNGIEATRQIRQFAPGTRILGLSLHNQPLLARKMIKMGATGYITKNSTAKEMIKAIMEVNNGNKYICEEIRNILSDQLLKCDQQSGGLQSLSERELQVIHCVRKGYSSKQIAEELKISLKTAEVHRYNILHKLNLKNSAALVNFINHQYENA